MSFMLVNAFMGEWLELRMDSARYRLLELLPAPDRPEFVPTPIHASANASPSQIEWSGQGGGKLAEPTVLPAEIVAAPTAAAGQAVIQNAPVQPTAAPVIIPVANMNGLVPVQPSVQLTGVIPEAQRFNNCGPTTLRMYLSFFGYTKDTQLQIANILKPYKEDRNVGPAELTGYAEEKGFRALARVNGNLERIKQFLSNGLPVMIEEGYDPPRAKQGWMGHYLLITGYDAEGITAQDSYNGPNQRVTWQDLDSNWRNFNRTYLLVYPEAQEPMVQAIIGEDLDDATMYAKAAQRAQEEWNANPADSFAAFNLGSSLVGLGEYEAAANAFDRARILQLPWRMMWYQFGPYAAYMQVGRYEEVLALANATLEPTGDLEESHYYKALALSKLGRGEEARQALEMALKFNPNYFAAQQALKELGL
jgi:tetratricopeptide (TPR) repeat protein